MNPDKVLRPSPGTLGDLEQACADVQRLLQGGQPEEASRLLADLQGRHGSDHAPLQEALSAQAEAREDWAAALRHYKRFHALSLQAELAPAALVTREQLLARLADRCQPPDAGMCLLGLAAERAGAGALPQMLRQQCRAQDLLALGQGEAMLLLLHQVDLPTGRKVCERIRAVWAQQQATPISLGLTAWRGPGDTPAALLARAESALQRSQREGGALRTG